MARSPIQPKKQDHKISGGCKGWGRVHKIGGLGILCQIYPQIPLEWNIFG